MTMHLARGLTNIRTTKPKHNKLTTAQHNKLTEEHRAFNKRMRQAGRHSERMTFEEYVDYHFGKKKLEIKNERAAPSEVKTYHWSAPAAIRETKVYPSFSGSSSGVASLPEKKTYTGTLVKGIAQTHKSNAVPVINDEEIIDIRHMRR
jgi:hypothetical protein